MKPPAAKAPARRWTVAVREPEIVEIPTNAYLPEIHSPGLADNTVASFATLSSGGKKTLFKCCFAVAMHRLDDRFHETHHLEDG